MGRSDGILVEPFGDAAWRVRLPGSAPARALLDALRALPGVIDAVVTERHAMVSFDPGAPPAGVEQAIAQALASPDHAVPVREHVVKVRYDGPDLNEVARGTGLRPDEVIARHTAATYVVAFLGFAPGFAYLRGLDPQLVVPRRATPRTRVPAGSVAIAGPYTGIYPFASQGGWSLLGTAIGFTPFDAQKGAALATGDRVRFAAEGA